MSTPVPYTCAELAVALRQYGDLPALVCLVDDADHEGPRTAAVRLELSMDPAGARVLVVTGYLHPGYLDRAAQDLAETGRPVG